MSHFHIDPIVYVGRPGETSGRAHVELAVYAFLDKLHVPYLRLDHDPAPTIESCEQVERKLGIKICKNLFLTNRQNSRFYLLSMPGHKSFHSSEVSKQAGSSRLSFAPPELMEALLHTSPGSASILSLLFDQEHQVTLLLDEDMVREEYFVCHPCVNTSSLRISTSDLLEHILPALDVKPQYLTLKLGKNIEIR